MVSSVVPPISALSQYPPRVPAQELVLRRHELHQFVVAQFGQVQPRRLLVVIDDLVNAAVAAVVAVLAGVVALVLVIPIDDIDRAVLVVELVEGLRPGIVEIQEVLAVMADVAGAAALYDVHVQSLAVDVSHEEFAAILRGPGLAQVTHHARVRMAAAGGVAAGVGGVRAEIPGPVDVVGRGFDVVIDKRINRLAAGVAILLVARDFVPIDAKVFPALPLEASALNHVVEVRDDAHLLPALAIFVEVNAPRIAAALGEDLEEMPRRVITPHPAVHPLPLALGCARFADARRAE